MAVEVAAAVARTVSSVFVVGLSGQVGVAVREKLRQRRIGIVALTRVEREDAAGVSWLLGELPDSPPWPAGIDTVLSLGPLDRFADWFDRCAPAGVRVIALGSTSLHTKRDSPDAAERDVARRLAAAEAVLFSTAARVGAAVTVLRPTLIYGAGADRSLSRLAEVARRRGWVVLPGSGTGLRQPVHVDDVADAVLRCLDLPATAGRVFDLPGGERLPASAMFERTVRTLAPGCRIWRVPGWLFRGLAALAVRLGVVPFSLGGFLARLRRDQIADPGPVEAALGLELRGFRP
jgi:nucleoside-diphosphate-sugar epimerase